MIYLDYAASTPTDPAVLRAFCEGVERWHANPDAAHAAGRAARTALAGATDAIAGMLGVAPAEIVYTSGASEANNTVVKGVLAAAGPGAHVLTTPLEHPSIRGPLQAAASAGVVVEELPLTADGRVDTAALTAALRPNTALVCVAAVDSELGTVQPVADIAAAVHTVPGCRLHLDAAQALGKTPLSVAGVDTASFAPHKFYGLVGSGLLYRRQGVALPALIAGGSSAQRAGTPAVGLALSIQKALELTMANADSRLQMVQRHNRRLRTALAAYPAVDINSPADAVPHILNISVRGVKGTVFQRALSEQGVCVSVRTACATAGAPSAAVLALTGDARRALSSWRISLSHLTTDAEIDGFLQAFDVCYRQLVKTAK